MVAGVVLFVLYRRKRKGKNDTRSQLTDPALPESRTVVPKKEESFPLMVQHLSMPDPVDPYSTKEHTSQLNVQTEGRSVQEWPSSEVKGPQYVNNSAASGYHPSTFAETPSSARNPQVHPSVLFQ